MALTYRPTLDGLRGVAAVLVVLSHATVLRHGLLAFGWVGVQLFFVLSGFLITEILVAEKDLPLPLYLRRFYGRRALRIFPVYFGFLVLLVALTPTAEEMDIVRRDWPYLVTFTANFGRIQRAGDLGLPYRHLWTLAIEEQFYLVWPLVVFALSRVSLRRAVVGLLFFAPIARAAIERWNEGLVGVPFTAELSDLVLPFAQVDSFATGAALVLFDTRVITNPTRFFGASLAIFGALAAAHFGVQHGWSRPGAVAEFAYTLGFAHLEVGKTEHTVWALGALNLVFGALLLVAQRGAGDGWLGRALAGRRLIAIGKVSYGMYVLHLPILLCAAAAASAPALAHLPALARDVGLLAAGLVVTALATVASYRFYEQPILRLKDRFFPVPAASLGRRPVTDEAPPLGASRFFALVLVPSLVVAAIVVAYHRIAGPG
jgi:peptidoglycan/LPS O-acetylase OafA/YrhL